MLHTILLIAQVVLAVSLIGLILIQRGKGAEAGAAFGAGASGTVFGARGSSSFLTRSTAVLATLFIANSLALAYLARQAPPEPDSLAERAAQMEQQEAAADESGQATGEADGDAAADAAADADAELPAMPEPDDAESAEDDGAESDDGGSQPAPEDGDGP